MAGFFSVIIKGQTYLNMLYLFLAFPLGLFYFVFLVTGLSLGFGLAITLVGIPLLFGMLLLWRVFGHFERMLTKIMLSMEITYIPIKHKNGAWKKIVGYLSDSYTWKGLAYLFIKFPLGLFSFIVLVTLLSIAVSLICVPVLYYLTEIGILQGTFCISNNICFIGNYLGAFIVSIVGVFLLLVFMHAFNGLARLYGMLAELLISRK